VLHFDQKKKKYLESENISGVFFTKIRRLINSCHAPTVDSVAITLVGTAPLDIGAGRPKVTPTGLPLLIIDDFPESIANRAFLSRLYINAHAERITVLVLTKDAGWGTRMVKINGGVKILPVDEVIRNPRRGSVEPFEKEPDWTGMGWSLEDLQKFAASLGEPHISEELRESMAPEAVQDLHAERSLIII
jgi:hypothetical protein